MRSRRIPTRVPSGKSQGVSIDCFGSFATCSQRRVNSTRMPYPRTSGTKSLFPPSRRLPRESSGALPDRPQRRRRPRQSRPRRLRRSHPGSVGKKVAHLSEYLGHQTNNFAEYQGLIAALEYAIQHGPKALKLISDSELLVRQIKGIYKVKNATLKDLHGRAKELIAQLEWFSIGHALREHNREADRLANEAMDKGMGRS